MYPHQIHTSFSLNMKIKDCARLLTSMIEMRVLFWKCCSDMLLCVDTPTWHSGLKQIQQGETCIWICAHWQFSSAAHLCFLWYFGQVDDVSDVHTRVCFYKSSLLAIMALSFYYQTKDWHKTVAHTQCVLQALWFCCWEHFLIESWTENSFRIKETMTPGPGTLLLIWAH